MDLDRLNPVTLITGAASGIGAASVRDLARRSQGGLILVDLNEEALTAVADDLEAQGAAPERMSTLAFDVADEERWAQATAFIEAQYGRLDWAVIHAGPPRAPESTDLIEFRSAGAVLDNAFQCLRATMPLMRKNQQGGAIILNASADALRHSNGHAAKNGLPQLLRVVAKEGAHDNIRVNAVAPGGADTPAWAKMPWFNDLVRETGSARAAFDKISKLASPMARYASGDDIARLVIMLLSDQSPMTGATLVVDGGRTL